MALRYVAAAVAALCVGTSANAAFLVTYSASQPTDNQFGAQLAAQGINALAVGAQIVLTAPGTVIFHYYGRESHYGQSFFAGPVTYSDSGHPVTPDANLFPVVENKYHAGQMPKVIGSAEFLAGPFDARVSTRTAVGVPSLTATGGDYVTNTLWLFGDDSMGSWGGDGDFDDLVIRATFDPAINLEQFIALPVPEPKTWLMLLSGFAAIGASIRRERRSLGKGRFCV